MKNNNTFVFSQIFWTKQSEDICYGRETNPPDSISQVVFITHASKGVHKVIMVYSVSLRNKFIKQNSMNTEAAFMVNKLFSPFVGMEMMRDSSTEMTAAAFLGCTHKSRSCLHLLSS
jgi:hypothetical protein